MRLDVYTENRSQPIAEKRITISPYQEIEFDTVFAAVTTGVDNRTGDVRHVLFSPGGGMPSTGVARVSLVTPELPGDAPAKRRAVTP